MADVIYWPHPTTVDTVPSQILDRAGEHEFESVFVMGYLKNGDFYFAASDADGGSLLWLMEVVKTRLMAIAGEPQ